MHARDSSGRQVSLLNDDSASNLVYRPSAYGRISYTSGSSGSDGSELLRSSSYDSQMSDPRSPTLPGVYDYGHAGASLYPNVTADGRTYDDYVSGEAPPTSMGGSSSSGSSSKHTSGFIDSSQSASYDEDSAANSSSIPERPGKRYPCRYRDTHGCDKTFTTSGHASRHSKIHTAEKAVQCTYLGCHKKFTRADNMKQHLETHYKDKSRSSGPRSSSSRSNILAAASGARRPSSSSNRASGSSSHHHHHRSSVDKRESTWEADPYATVQSLNGSPLHSPVANGAWDMRGMGIPLLNRPVNDRTPNSGLDALAMAVACQEGGGGS